MTGISLLLQSYLSNNAENVVLDRQTVEMMLASCNRQLQLIDSLVETQKLGMAVFPLKKQSILLQALLGNIIKTWERKFASSQVHIHNRIPLDLPYINADPDQLWRVFENLIGL